MSCWGPFWCCWGPLSVQFLFQLGHYPPHSFTKSTTDPHIVNAPYPLISFNKSKNLYKKNYAPLFLGIIAEFISILTHAVCAQVKVTVLDPATIKLEPGSFAPFFSQSYGLFSLDPFLWLVISSESTHSNF